MDIEQLTADVTAARRRQATATARAEQLVARVAAAREDLQGEFGVTTAADARLLLASLEQELEKEAAGVREQLRLAEGAA